MNTMIWPASCQKLQIQWQFECVDGFFKILIETKNAPGEQVMLAKLIPKDLTKSQLFGEAKKCLLDLAYQNKYSEYQRSLYMYDAYVVQDFIDDLEEHYYV